MKNRKLTLLSIFMLLPLSAFAHGENVILPFLYMLVSGIVFAIAMLTINIDIKIKALLFLIYIIASFLCAGLLLSRSYGDFLRNETIINAQVVIYPIVAVLLAYFIIKVFKRNSSQ